MANRRIWLLHKPTGKKHLLAKHWANGWRKYDGKAHEPYFSMQDLFDNTDFCNEDFVIEYGD